VGEIVIFILGVVIGFLFGVAIYWLPIGQFFNELKSLWSLVSKRYPDGTQITVRGGIDIKPQNSALHVLFLTRDTLMTVWLDEGIGWHFTNSGWVRARILQVWMNESKDEVPNLYRICHKDILRKLK
jgi:hypothetical protein